MPQRKRGLTGLLVLIALAAVTATAGSMAFAQLLSAGGWGIVDLLLIVLFAILYFWISIGFWTATFGFVWSLTQSEPPSDRSAIRPQAGRTAALPKTAVVMPIYNEDPRRVFANLRAIRASLDATGQSDAFDILALSDTRNPDIWAEEEAAWARMRSGEQGRGLYYRRRTENVDRKSGNIRDFCRRWGSRYRYMVVLDADSLMTGDTLVEMVHRMEADAEIGILQVPPTLVNHDSFFARLLQFSSALYGDVFRSGFSLWAGAQGNYWGHNAIIRVEPFTRCCGLPHLPGKPPWGGQILSHDFVEAALMLRDGWKVLIAGDLGGSYEECPANLIDFAKRDERWSMGNLQHLSLTTAHGLHPVSRFHLGIGALSYLASPLWAMFLVLSMVQGVAWHMSGRYASTASGEASPSFVAVAPLIGALALLLLVKLWALLIALWRPSTVARFGAPSKLVASVLLETAVGCLMAPILMAFHTGFVINAVLRRKVEWEAQRRDENAVSFGEAFRVHAPQTIAGLGAALIVTWTSHGLFWWMSPVLLGLVFSAPLSLLMSSVPIGRWLRAAGILLIPEEISPPPILQLQRDYLAEEMAACAATPHPLVRLIADPLLLGLHLAMLPQDHRSLVHASTRERLQRIALSAGPNRLTRGERLLLMQDRDALQRLHRRAWSDWPIGVLQKVAGIAAPAAATSQVGR
jgi:membrane glycosyltransferase